MGAASPEVGLKSDLEAAKVAGVPSEDFGAQQHSRFSYATSLPDIEKGCTRISDAVGKLS